MIFVGNDIIKASRYDSSLNAAKIYSSGVNNVSFETNGLKLSITTEASTMAGIISML